MLSQLHENKQAIIKYHKQLKVDHGSMVEEQDNKWNNKSDYYLKGQNKEAQRFLHDIDSRKN